MSSSDPFSARFDSIAVDPANAPSAEAIERALAFVVPESDHGNAGFYLMNDAGGRFVVDRDMGVISVASDAILTADAGSVHPVRLKVIEASGAHYELDMALKITGRVPQMIGAEDFGVLAGIAADVAPPPPITIARTATPWTRFAVTQGAAAPAPLGAEGAVFGTLLSADFNAVHASRADLTLVVTPPAPSRASAAWSI